MLLKGLFPILWILPQLLKLLRSPLWTFNGTMIYVSYVICTEARTIFGDLTCSCRVPETTDEIQDLKKLASRKEFNGSSAGAGNVTILQILPLR
jgi:hypothetical protein